MNYVLEKTKIPRINMSSLHHIHTALTVTRRDYCDIEAKDSEEHIALMRVCCSLQSTAVALF
jgi:hypothetical protein